MTPEEWMSLKRGDVIIEARSGVERKILSVTHYRPKNAKKIRTSITLKKLVETYWTKRGTTTYNNYDDRGRWILKKPEI